MKVDRYHPRTVDEIRKLVADLCQVEQSILLQAGHFLLFYDEESKLTHACIANPDSPKSNDILQAFGHFPLLTWELGIDILNRIPCSTKEILLLVNDWQYLPKEVQRNEFYSDNPDIPNAFKEALEQNQDISLLKPEINGEKSITGSFFGEMNLRNRYKKRISRLIRSNAMPTGADPSLEGDHITCTMSLSGEQPTEIYCSGKSADCTAEVAELLLQVSAYRPDTIFINMYPLVCRDFVELNEIQSVLKTRSR